jgi:hypothetical protein
MPVTLPLGRQVLLHPALVDTALGCESRLIDQFVDAATGGAKFRNAAEQLVSDQSALYTIAWGIQFERLDAPPFATSDATEANWLTDLRKIVPDILKNQDIKLAAERAVASRSDWSDSDRSPMTTKTTFYDKALVEQVSQCLRQSGDLEHVETCLRSQEISEDYRATEKWLAPPPQVRPESGVREQPYEVDKDLSFLDLGADHRDALWPFDFMLQETFESPPFFSEKFANGEFAFDEDPFEFPAIKGLIHSAVATALRHDNLDIPDAGRALDDMREFAVLQRFFRLALNGKLGASFPLSKLVDLGRIAPQNPVSNVRTLRWNNVSPDLRALFLAQGYGPQMKALGYDTDYEQFMRDGGRCPAILP